MFTGWGRVIRGGRVGENRGRVCSEGWGYYGEGGKCNKAVGEGKVVGASGKGEGVGIGETGGEKTGGTGQWEGWQGKLGA